MARPRIVITPGDPAGIGPDIVLKAAASADFSDVDIAVIADRAMLQARVEAPGAPAIKIVEYDERTRNLPGPGQLPVIHQPCPAPIHPGEPDPAHGEYVIACIDQAVDLCRDGRFDGMTTGPVNKAVINRAGIPFSGHTEWIAARCDAPSPVMMLVGGGLRVCLLTVHVPLAEVPRLITARRLNETVDVILSGLRELFAIPRPAIGVCALNPHAGEGGYLGVEEDEVIAPTLDKLRAQHGHGERCTILGPLPADTAFTPARLKSLDAVLAMYHDQGLPVSKYAGFGAGVNLTLGLPILRTSVDHGTAYELAGAFTSEESSLKAALALAGELAQRRAAN